MSAIRVCSGKEHWLLIVNNIAHKQNNLRMSRLAEVVLVDLLEEGFVSKLIAFQMSGSMLLINSCTFKPSMLCGDATYSLI